ncbi:ankyrin repeat-containing domain protein [Phaeosphaeria sp. MPI-PUGE-AT-0046c]|nr:ankyrin repeat-containing domain protein [Phaeosphaeria sp. MPI-PUGE-AT-0046c]
MAASGATKAQHGQFQTRAEGLGFEVIEASKGPAKYEIVAIPGIGKDEAWSWKLNRTHWLRDTSMLARKIPDARISIFNYSNEGFEKGPINQRLESMARKLLQGLDRMRDINNTRTPIIFVCHSMGGIVLEKTLLLARAGQDEYPLVYPYVAGSVFLGTPFHRVTEPRAQILAEMAETLMGTGTMSDIVEFLARDEKVLRDLHNQFALLVTETQIRLYCFFEKQETERLKFAIKGISKTSYKAMDRVVDEESAKHSSANYLGLAADHFRLNKFENPKDPNFTIVSEEIRVITHKADKILKSRQKDQIQALVDGKTFRSMTNALGKKQDIEAATGGQYAGPKGSGLLGQVAFKTWREDDAKKLLWVHGKAGTGQGAVASSAIESLKPSKDSSSIVAAFFCDQKQRRSFLGLLQLVILQVIEANQDLAIHLLSDSKKAKAAGKQEFDPESITKVQVLWDALQAMAKKLTNAHIYIVVYGLEQLSKESLDEFLSYLKDFNDASPLMDEAYDATPIKWLLLSRSGRPNIDDCLKSRALGIDLEDEANAALVSSNLKLQISAEVDSLYLPSSLAYFVKRHISARCEDNEIYVKLVVQDLKNTWVPGKTQHADIRRLLESHPYGLTNLFEHIRKRVLNPNADQIEYTKEILRCQICAQDSPTLRDLAVMAGIPKEDRGSSDKLKAYIVRCGAFLTLDGWDWDIVNTRVQWINITAQEYLQQDAKDILALDLEVQHGIIALRCLEYISETFDPEPPGEDDDDEHDEDAQDNASNVNGSNADDNESHGSENNDNDEGNTSNTADNSGDTSEIDDLWYDDSVKYPLRFWYDHAKLTDRDVLNELDYYSPLWVAESSARERYWSAAPPAAHDHTQQGDISALHMAVILKFPALVERLLEEGNSSDCQREDSTGCRPLYYACLTGDEDIVNTMLGADADIDFVKDDNHPTALYAAASAGNNDIIKRLLDLGADVNATSEEFGTALYTAIEQHLHDTAKLLISRGAKVNTIGGPARRPLNVASLVGNLEGVKLLIDHGADIDPDEDYWYGSALGAACRNGHLEIVEHLLLQNWNSNRLMKTYGSFLTAAATYNHVDVVEALLKTESRLPVLETALRASAQRGYEDVVRAILRKNGTLELRRAFSKAAYYGRDDVLVVLFEHDVRGELHNNQQIKDDALYQATDMEHEETVKLLLEHGASPNARGETYGCALTASAYDGTTYIMEALLEKKADVNQRGGEYGTALQAAAYRGDVDNVRLLLDHGALLNTPPIGLYGNELQAAVQTGNEETISLLIERGADVNTFGGKYSFSIIAAVSEGYSDALKILLEHGAKVNVRGGENNWPVISLAASTLLTDDLELILNHHADIDDACDKGTTALINCAAAQDEEGLEFLLARGANVNIASKESGSALYAAAAIGNEACCEILIKAGADVNAIGGEMGTPLQAAAWTQDLETVQLLLNSSADVVSESLVCGFYGTALQAAAMAGSLVIVQELLDHEAPVNLSVSHGEFGCALQAAVVSEVQEIVELLLDKGADVDFHGGYHHLPLMTAAQTPNHDILKMLLEHGADPSAQGGMWGSVAIAAAYGNSMECLQTLLEHGADLRATGGQYASSLQAAALKADLDIVEYILDRAPELIHHYGGKYHTPLIAAAYFDRMEVVTKLLDRGADFRVQGGKYRSAITAAAIRGNKAVLEKLLEMSPPEHLVDEALVEAVAHRQSASVDLLLQSRANVFTRHPTLGSPTQALEAPEVVDTNSDDGEDFSDDEDEDDNDEDDEDVQWEGDDGKSVSGDTEDGSIVGLELEEVLDESAKIKKLLDEAEARRKRNPTVERFRSVRHRGPPSRYRAHGQDVPPMPQMPQVPPMPRMTQVPYQQPAGNIYGSSHTLPSQNSWNSPAQQPFIAQANYPPPSNPSYGGTSTYGGYSPSNPGQGAYPSTVVARKPVGSPSGTPPREQSPHVPQQGQYSLPNSQLGRQYSSDAMSQVSGSFTPPSRQITDDQGLRRSSQAKRQSVVNPGPSGRYQQRQTSNTSLQETIGRQDFAQPGQTPPPQAPYNAFAQQQHPPALPSRHSQQYNPSSPPQQYSQMQQGQQGPPSQPGYQGPPPPSQYHSAPQGHYRSPPSSQNQSQQPQQYQPYSSPPPTQGSYAPYNHGSQSSSQASFQNSQYANSTPQAGQGSWNSTPASSQGAFRNSDQKQGNRWGGGGYDGDGYGG